MNRREAIQVAERMARDNLFSRRVAAFIERWAPTDPHDAAAFTADLVTIVHHTWLDTTTPDRRLVERMVGSLASFRDSKLALETPVVRVVMPGQEKGDG